MRQRRRWIASTALGLVALVGLATMPLPGAGAQSPAEVLQILLTNDDGVDAGYINIVRETLCEAGHDVTVVAPSGDQSGNSSRFTTARDAKLQVARTSFACGAGTGEQHAVSSTWTSKLSAGGTYSYSGPASPVDATRFGLDVVFADAAPDVVVSGANPGPNLSSVVLKSGTVGAVLAAAAKGVPGIALSVAFNTDDDARAGFPASRDAAEALSSWTVELLDELQRNRRGTDPLLPSGVSLNVNHPTPLADDRSYDQTQVGDAVLTVAGRRDLIPIEYVPTGVDGEYRVSLMLCGMPGSPAQCDEPEIRDADTTAVDRNQISVQPMNGDVTITPPASSGLKKVLSRLNN